MAIRKLNSIFKPQRIAIIGVPTDPLSVGGITLSNLVSGGFRGVVYPVNPKHEAVMGIPCYPNVKSLPKTPDLAVIILFIFSAFVFLNVCQIKHPVKVITIRISE